MGKRDRDYRILRGDKGAFLPDLGFGVLERSCILLRMHALVQRVSSWSIFKLSHYLELDRLLKEHQTDS